ncbi:hypothetical protein ACDP63_11355, partial [Paracoccus sp. P2]|uniref:hypothetical protein n=1 Tax=Paracoccus sp. P2 TaxID=3248840 RepID=UPI00391F7A20
MSALEYELEGQRAKNRKLKADLAEARAEIERLTLLLDLSKKTTEAVLERANKAEAARDANAKWLGELLAVIHRDGGHYQSQHGDE